MQSNGWIKLYRKLHNSDMYNNLNSKQRDVMINLLLLANHKTNKWEWQGEIFECEEGQLITSLQGIKKVCANDVSIQNIRTAIDKLEKWDFLTNKSTKTGRLITVVNWGNYQGSTNGTNKGSNKEPTKHQQSTNKALTTNKNYKECLKNDKEEVIDTSASEKSILKIIKNIEKYPYNYKKDLEHIRELATDYPSIDMLNEVKKWRTYKKDKPLKDNSNARLQLRNWIENAYNWSDNKETQKDEKLEKDYSDIYEL